MGHAAKYRSAQQTVPKTSSYNWPVIKQLFPTTAIRTGLQRPSAQLETRLWIWIRPKGFISLKYNLGFLGLYFSTVMQGYLVLRFKAVISDTAATVNMQLSMLWLTRRTRWTLSLIFSPFKLTSQVWDRDALGETSSLFSEQTSSMSSCRDYCPCCTCSCSYITYLHELYTRALVHSCCQLVIYVWQPLPGWLIKSSCSILFWLHQSSVSSRHPALGPPS